MDQRRLFLPLSTQRLQLVERIGSKRRYFEAARIYGTRVFAGRLFYSVQKRLMSQCDVEARGDEEACHFLFRKIFAGRCYAAELS